MKTKAQIILELKSEYPTLQSGSDEIGYVNLTDAQYETTIDAWADDVIVKENHALALVKAEAAKAAAEAKLAALGLTTDDLKALGLGNN